MGGQKIVQNLARFLTTFDFGREYLRTRSTYRKSEKNSFNHNPFHVGRKKLGELWCTNNRDLMVHIDPPNWFFFGRLYFHLAKASELRKSPVSPKPTLFNAAARGIPSEFLDETYLAKTRGMRLLYGENCMILTSVFNRFRLIHPCDGRTDRRTDGR